MIDNVIVEHALPTEWEEAMELVWKTFLKHEAKVYTKEGVDNFLKFISDERLYRMFLNGDYKLYVVRLDGKIVGVCSARSKNHISLLFVGNDYQKQGIGRKLLACMQNDISKETDSLLMTVNAAPVAIKFYEKLGFVNTDSFKEADGVTYQPMTIFKKIDI